MCIYLFFASPEDSSAAKLFAVARLALVSMARRRTEISMEIKRKCVRNALYVCVCCTSNKLYRMRSIRLEELRTLVHLSFFMLLSDLKEKRIVWHVFVCSAVYLLCFANVQWITELWDTHKSFIVVFNFIAFYGGGSPEGFHMEQLRCGRHTVQSLKTDHIKSSEEIHRLLPMSLSLLFLLLQRYNL